MNKSIIMLLVFTFLFTVDLCSQPSAPVLYSPPNGSYTLYPVIFKWYRSAGATNYRLQLSSDSTFQSIIYNDSTLTDTTKTFNSGLPNMISSYWRVSARNSSGTGPWSSIWKFTLFIEGIYKIGTEIPNSFSLFQNFPNPFNPSTNINFSIPKKSFVKIIIYDALGKAVDDLVNTELNAGTYKIDWQADKFASGVYYYQLKADSYTETKRMVLIK